MPRFPIRLILLAMVAMLAACGQKGDLVKPPATPASGKTAPVAPGP